VHCAKISPEFECQGQTSKVKVTGDKKTKCGIFWSDPRGAFLYAGGKISACCLFVLYSFRRLKQQHGLLIEKTTDSGRSFKVRGQEWGSEAVPSVESRVKPPDIVWEPWPQKLTTLLVKISYFVTVLRMTRRYLHSPHTNVQYEM